MASEPQRDASIVAGNEKVLRARLSDAGFFWDQDRKARLESRIPALADVKFYEKLGSMADKVGRVAALARLLRSEEHTSELQSLMRISYAVFCLKKKTQRTHTHNTTTLCT